jgi:hypothetical protein
MQVKQDKKIKDEKISDIRTTMKILPPLSASLFSWFSIRFAHVLICVLSYMTSMLKKYKPQRAPRTHEGLKVLMKDETI